MKSRAFAATFGDLRNGNLHDEEHHGEFGVERSGGTDPAGDRLCLFDHRRPSAWPAGQRHHRLLALADDDGGARRRTRHRRYAAAHPASVENAGLFDGGTARLCCLFAASDDPVDADPACRLYRLLLGSGAAALGKRCIGHHRHHRRVFRPAVARRLQQELSGRRTTARRFPPHDPDKLGAAARHRAPRRHLLRRERRACRLCHRSAPDVHLDA